MPMPIAHGLLGASLVAALLPKSPEPRYTKQLLTGAVLANLADLDFLLVFITHNKDWHRGITHSITFSLLVGLLFFLYFKKQRWREALAYSAAYASHFLLDFITTKIGGGIELFSPFAFQRYGLRWFGLSEYPSRMSIFEIVQSLTIEFVVFFLLFLLVIYLRRKSSGFKGDHR